MHKFLLIEKPSPQVACLYASSVQSSVVRSKTKGRLDATQIHEAHHANATQVIREARAKPWIAEATAMMQVRKSMNPSVSAEDMLQTSSCSRIAAQGFSKVACLASKFLQVVFAWCWPQNASIDMCSYVLLVSGCSAYNWLPSVCWHHSYQRNWWEQNSDFARWSITRFGRSGPFFYAFRLLNWSQN